MFKKLLHASLALLLTSSLALAAFHLSWDGKLISVGSGTAPAVSGCGGSPTITGTDVAGTVTLGTSATACIITFNAAYALAPHCVVQWIANPLAAQSYTTSASAITLAQTSASNNVIKYICIAQPGG